MCIDYYALNKITIICVVTLTLGSWPKQGLAKAQVENEAQESHFMLLGV